MIWPSFFEATRDTWPASLAWPFVCAAHAAGTADIYVPYHAVVVPRGRFQGINCKLCCVLGQQIPWHMHAYETRAKKQWPLPFSS